MARPKEFNRDEALARALDLFHEQGYEATTIADLVAATGVQRQSLYDTFGDKHALYVEALDLYLQRAAALPRALEAGEGGASPLAQLRQLFRKVAAEAVPGNSGCLIVSSAVERSHCDDAVTDRAVANVACLEKAFATVVLRAQDAGEVPRSVRPMTAARLLVTLLWGLRAMGRAAPDAAWQRSVVDGALGLLTSGAPESPPPPPATRAIARASRGPSAEPASRAAGRSTRGPSAAAPARPAPRAPRRPRPPAPPPRAR